jgi:hypothetical protein
VDLAARLHQRVVATTLPGVRTLLLVMTILGGLLTLVAAVWVAELSRRDRWRKRNLDRLLDKYHRQMQLHSRAYRDYGNQLDQRQRTGQGPVPVRPFGDMDQQAHYDQLTAEHFQRVEARIGRDPMQPDSDRDVQRDVLAKLLWPARLAWVGVVLSTLASAASLYLPPNV